MTSQFPFAKKKELGYRVEQVDAFLERARRAFEQSDPSMVDLSSAEIRRTGFEVRKYGYSSRFVDAAMDRLEEVFFERERRNHIRQFGEDAWWERTQELLSEVRGRLQRPRGKRLRSRGWFASGYKKSQVDAFLDRVVDMLAGRAELTTGEVRAVVFHTQWRGYDEDQVDALLDAIIELILATR